MSIILEFTTAATTQLLTVRSQKQSLYTKINIEERKEDLSSVEAGFQEVKLESFAMRASQNDKTAMKKISLIPNLAQYGFEIEQEEDDCVITQCRLNGFNYTFSDDQPQLKVKLQSEKHQGTVNTCIITDEAKSQELNASTSSHTRQIQEDDTDSAPKDRAAMRRGLRDSVMKQQMMGGGGGLGSSKSATLNKSNSMLQELQSIQQEKKFQRKLTFEAQNEGDNKSPLASHNQNILNYEPQNNNKSAPPQFSNNSSLPQFQTSTFSGLSPYNQISSFSEQTQLNQDRNLGFQQSDESSIHNQQITNETPSIREQQSSRFLSINLTQFSNNNLIPSDQSNIQESKPQDYFNSIPASNQYNSNNDSSISPASANESPFSLNTKGSTQSKSRRNFIHKQILGVLEQEGYYVEKDSSNKFLEQLQIKEAQRLLVRQASMDFETSSKGSFAEQEDSSPNKEENSSSNKKKNSKMKSSLAGNSNLPSDSDSISENEQTKLEKKTHNSYSENLIPIHQVEEKTEELDADRRLSDNSGVKFNGRRNLLRTNVFHTNVITKTPNSSTSNGGIANWLHYNENSEERQEEEDANNNHNNQTHKNNSNNTEEANSRIDERLKGLQARKFDKIDLKKADSSSDSSSDNDNEEDRRESSTKTAETNKANCGGESTRNRSMRMNVGWNTVNLGQGNRISHSSEGDDEEDNKSDSRSATNQKLLNQYRTLCKTGTMESDPESDAKHKLEKINLNFVDKNDSFGDDEDNDKYSGRCHSDQNSDENEYNPSGSYTSKSSDQYMNKFIKYYNNNYNHNNIQFDSIEEMESSQESIRKSSTQNSVRAKYPGTTRAMPKIDNPSGFMQYMNMRRSKKKKTANSQGDFQNITNSSSINNSPDLFFSDIIDRFNESIVDLNIVQTQSVRGSSIKTPISPTKQASNQFQFSINLIKSDDLSNTVSDKPETKSVTPQNDSELNDQNSKSELLGSSVLSMKNLPNSQALFSNYFSSAKEFKQLNNNATIPQSDNNTTNNLQINQYTPQQEDSVKQQELDSLRDQKSSLFNVNNQKQTDSLSFLNKSNPLEQQISSIPQLFISPNSQSSSNNFPSINLTSNLFNDKLLQQQIDSKLAPTTPQSQKFDLLNNQQQQESYSNIISHLSNLLPSSSLQAAKVDNNNQNFSDKPLNNLSYIPLNETQNHSQSFYLTSSPISGTNVNKLQQQSFSHFSTTPFNNNLSSSNPINISSLTSTLKAEQASSNEIKQSASNNPLSYNSYSNYMNGISQTEQASNTKSDQQSPYSNTYNSQNRYPVQLTPISIDSILTKGDHNPNMLNSISSQMNTSFTPLLQSPYVLQNTTPINKCASPQTNQIQSHENNSLSSSQSPSIDLLKQINKNIISSPNVNQINSNNNSMNHHNQINYGQQEKQPQQSQFYTNNSNGSSQSSLNNNPLSQIPSYKPLTLQTESSPSSTSNSNINPYQYQPTTLLSNHDSPATTLNVLSSNNQLLNTHTYPASSIHDNHPLSQFASNITMTPSSANNNKSHNEGMTSYQSYNNSEYQSIGNSQLNNAYLNTHSSSQNNNQMNNSNNNYITSSITTSITHSINPMNNNANQVHIQTHLNVKNEEQGSLTDRYKQIDEVMAEYQTKNQIKSFNNLGSLENTYCSTDHYKNHSYSIPNQLQFTVDTHFLSTSINPYNNSVDQLYQPANSTTNNTGIHQQLTSPMPSFTNLCSQVASQVPSQVDLSQFDNSNPNKINQQLVGYTNTQSNQKQNECKNGYGTHIYQDGSSYLGNFMNDKKNGHGQEYNKFNQLIYEGEFLEDQYHGTGIYHNQDKQSYSQNKIVNYENLSNIESQCISYEGTFSYGQKNGNGKITFFNNDTFNGYFIAGKPSGYGEYVSASNNETVRGVWNDGIMQNKY